MKIIVGLGNPGEKYDKTRHNLGFMTLDALLEKFEPLKQTFWEDEKKLKSQVKELTIKNEKVLLVKPQTFMNDSGEAVVKVLNYYKVELEDLYVIHDDLDLPYGKIRIRFGGSGGGHHGIESIIEHVGDKFLRIRLGIGSDTPQKEDNKRKVEDYVLGRISSQEKGKTKTMTHEAIKSLELILEHGIEKYMGKYNK